MLAVKVQEATTTTGTGDITLAGASENGQTFASQFATNVPFNYFIDDRAGNWESGTGYLSDSTTLVRQNPLKGSAVTPVNFGAGTKQVFNNVSSNSVPKCYPYRPDSTAVITDRVIAPYNAALEGVSVTMTADRIYYVPFEMVYGQNIDAIGYRGNAGITGTVLMALYSFGTDGLPDSAIIKGSIDASTGGLSFASVTAQIIPPGMYWAAIWCDAAAQVRGTFWYRMAPLNYAGYNFELRPASGFYVDGQSSLLSLPDSAISPTSQLTNTAPCPLLRFE